MYQVLGPKVIVAVAAWAAVSLLTIFGAIAVSVPLRIVVTIVDVLLLSVLFSNPVWRFVWNQTGPIGTWLSRKIYPDLNGTYDVMLESNWPVVKRMLDAARHDAESFDPFNPKESAPGLLMVELEARIEQTWFEISMWMYPKTPDAVIKRSNTLATIPVKTPANFDNELIYVFEQENDSRAPTDDERHQGAARLKIDHEDSSKLSGEYWNNRAWRRGVNAAGRLTLVRRSDPPKFAATTPAGPRNLL
jgi:hypothetical protein